MLKTLLLAGVAWCALPSVAEAACVWSRELSDPHHHAIFCSSPDDPDLARVMRQIAVRESLVRLQLLGPVDLILKSGRDGSLRQLQPYMFRLQTAPR